jgi:transposase-like protein
MIKRSEKEVIVAAYLSGGYSYRELSVKHNYSLGAVHKWVKEYTDKMVKPIIKKKSISPSAAVPEDAHPMPTDVKTLQAELRKAQLLNKLLNEVIVIAEEEFGIPIRKKPGTKRS